MLPRCRPSLLGEKSLCEGSQAGQKVPAGQPASSRPRVSLPVLGNSLGGPPGLLPGYLGG